MMPRMPHRPRGFTLMELMVVVSILAAMTALVLVSVDSMNTASMHALDMSNQRSIARANIQHAEEHQGLLLHPRTDRLSLGELNQFANDSSYDLQLEEIPALVERGDRRLWVRAYDDALATRLITVDPGQPASMKIEKVEALVDGEAWQYMDGNPANYKSPLDTTNRLRSYSLNAYIGCEISADDIYARGSWTDPFYGQFVKYSVPCPTLSYIKQPANTICSITEDDPGHSGGNPPGHNLLGFMLHPNQMAGYSNYQIWHDLPGLWDPARMNLSYMDGSTRQFLFSEPELASSLDTNGDGIPNHRATFDGPDIRRLQKQLLPGVLEYRTDSDVGTD
ncbi:MAG: type II secretion system GspH family protein [Phycisphaerales bacterium]|nr:type II secretion system GspH family protein [Phycisphaerales bacterium]